MNRLVVLSLIYLFVGLFLDAVKRPTKDNLSQIVVLWLPIAIKLVLVFIIEIFNLMIERLALVFYANSKKTTQT